MRRLLTLLTLLFVLPFLVACSKDEEVQEPPQEILGIRLGMSEADARERLDEIGQLEKEERKRQEVWALDEDPRFSHLIVGFDEEKNTVRYVTAVAHPEGEPMRYADVANLDDATELNSPQNYRYEWAVVNEADEQFDYLVTARGTDPQFLTTYSVKRLN